MKKYQKPLVKWMEIESEEMMIPQVSGTPANEEASAKGHSISFDWDEDDYSSESTCSNPNVFDEN